MIKSAKEEANKGYRPKKDKGKGKAVPRPIASLVPNPPDNAKVTFH